MERALAQVGWRGNSLRAAGRTDQGVHALGQVIGFQLEWRHKPEDLTRALNANLPTDIAVRHTEVVSPEFHPRFSAISRRYRYSVLVDPYRDPIQERYSWRLGAMLDVKRMNRAAAELIGEKDFGAFGTAPVQGGHTRRNVQEAFWEGRGEHLRFEIEADAFLYHMVRRIVALLVAVGQDRESLDTIQRLILEPDSVWPGNLAPACGLCLTQVKYERPDPDPSYESKVEKQE